MEKINSGDMNSTIERFSGDTYPEKKIIKINGVAANISDWSIILRYRDADGTEKDIDCVISSPKDGRILIYPHHRTVFDGIATDSTTPSKIEPSDFNTSNKCWNEQDTTEYTYAIIRKRDYDGYVEEITSETGTIKIYSRL